jgi:hypothetical protein
MPHFGEKRKGKQLDKKRGVYVWVKCALCKKGKWTPSKIPHDDNFVSQTRCIKCCTTQHQVETPPYTKKQVSSGYMAIFVPSNDPFVKLSKTSSKYGAWMLEHRYVMSKHVNRVLQSDESVHHKNGIRNDNCIENLELWLSKHGAGQRTEDIALEYVKSLNDDELINFLKRARNS